MVSKVTFAGFKVVSVVMWIRPWAEHSGSLFHLKIGWLIRKDAGESGPRSDTGALMKEQNHNFAERFNRKWTPIAILR